jgi:hypothetical protein
MPRHRPSSAFNPWREIRPYPFPIALFPSSLCSAPNHHCAPPLVSSPFTVRRLGSVEPQRPPHPYFAFCLGSHPVEPPLPMLGELLVAPHPGSSEGHHITLSPPSSSFPGWRPGEPPLAPDCKPFPPPRRHLR